MRRIAVFNQDHSICFSVNWDSEIERMMDGRKEIIVFNDDLIFNIKEISPEGKG